MAAGYVCRTGGRSATTPRTGFPDRGRCIIPEIIPGWRIRYGPTWCAVESREFSKHGARGGHYACLAFRGYTRPDIRGPEVARPAGSALTSAEMVSGALRSADRVAARGVREQD